MDLLKPILDSIDPDESFNKHGFYISSGRYFTISFKGKDKSEIELSNFVGESMVHLINGTNNSRRIIKIQRHTSEIEIVEVQSSELKPDSFETILKSKRCTFFGTANHLKRIFADWMDRETEANIIETLGWNKDLGVYAFSNAVFTKRNKILEVNNYGIIEDPHGKRRYYLPDYGLANIDDPDYEGERKFLYQAGSLNFEQYTKLYFEAFESNGGIVILYLILSVFGDVIFDQVGFFPFLFLFGAYGTGKTSLVEFLLRIFGKDFKGIPLNNSTGVALSRTMASRKNTIFYLKEYTNDTEASNQDLLLTAYDGTGRSTGIKSNDNRTKSSMVSSSLILDGNELPTQKSAVLSRMILLNFESNQFTVEQKKAFSELEKIQDKGFGKVLTEILQQRKYFSDNFLKTFSENRKELEETFPADFAERTMKHVALLLTPAKLLHDKLKFPFSFEEITREVVNNAIEQNRLLKDTSETSIFWNALAYGIKNNSLIEFRPELPDANPKHAHYRVKYAENILQIKLQSIYPDYVKYCKNNNLRFLDFNSLRMLLTSKSNPDFIPSNQKGRGVYYTDTHFRSCYQFQMKEENNVISINEIEINF